MSRNFNGTNSDYIEPGSAIYESHEDSPFSMGCMFRADVFAGDQRSLITIFEDGGGNRRPLQLHIDTDGTLKYIWNGSTYITSTALSADTWYSVLVTYDGTKAVGSVTMSIMEVSTNTIIENEATNASGITVTGALTVPIIIGSRSDGAGEASGDNFDGDIAHVFFLEGDIGSNITNLASYNDAPSTAFATWEVAETPLFYYKLDSADVGSVATDSSTASNDAAINGATLTAEPPYSIFEFIPSGNELFEPTLTSEAVTLSVDHLSTSILLHEPVLSNVVTQQLDPDYISTGNALHEPFGFNYDLIESTVAFYQPTLNIISIAVDYIDSSYIIYQPLVQSSIASVDFIAGNSFLYEPAITTVLAQQLDADFIDSVNTLYEPSLMLQDSIDGQPTLVIATNYQSKTLYCNINYFTID